jgi:acyl carrier protein
LVLPAVDKKKRNIMEAEQRKGDLINFLRTIQRPDCPLQEIDGELSLVESGLIDSLALLQIITYLEQTYGIDFSEKGIDPGELRSVNAILEFVAREATG